jgi:hypothetical protein
MIDLARLWCVIVVAACTTSPKPPVAHATSPRTPLDEARAYERGAGVARDYRAAADIYRTACRDGRGEVEACGALIRAGMRGRGVDIDHAALGALATRTCLAQHDPFSCVVADLSSGSEKDLPPEVMDAVKAALSPLPTCDAAHASACWMLLIGAGFPGSDGTSAEERRRSIRHQACVLGIVQGCVELVSYSEGDDEPEVADASRRLVAACDGGDADACEAAPGRAPLAPTALCAANDYEACARAACLGDARLETATSHGARIDDCERVRTKANALGPQAVLRALVDLRDRMCACTSAPCAEKLEDDHEKLMQRLAREETSRASPDVAARSALAEQQYAACRAKLGVP